MKGSIGASASIYHTRLPHQRKLLRMARTVSQRSHYGATPI